MTTTTRIHKHETALKILECIKKSRRIIRTCDESIAKYCLVIDNRPYYFHQIEISKAAIVRLESRYEKVMKELIKEADAPDSQHCTSNPDKDVTQNRKG